MHRRMMLGCSLLALAKPVRAEAPWSLVTYEEAQLEREAPRPPKTRGLPRSESGGPNITVELPDTGRALRPPLTFRVRFTPVADTPIDPNSFRASYGALGLDITDRLLRHARFSGQVLAAENVTISAGTHTVTLSIADTAGRKASRTFQFEVMGGTAA